jgi:hypothetical protein
MRGGGQRIGKIAKTHKGGQLGLVPLSYISSQFPKLLIKLYFHTNILLLGKMIKPFFLFSAIQ